MQLTGIIYPGTTKRWMVAVNPETGTTSQGRTAQAALANLKEATELYLEEKRLFKKPAEFVTPFEVKLPSVTGQRVARALERLGFERKRQRGIQLVMRRGGDVCVVPMRREVDQCTLRDVLRQARVTDEEFLHAI